MPTLAPAPAVDIRRAAVRPTTRIGWLDSRHSFPSGRRYDPADAHHGLLLVSSDDRVGAAEGSEILVWEMHAELAA